MKRYILVCLVCFFSILQAKSIVDYLDTQCTHIQTNTDSIDAAFIIRLQERKDLTDVKQNFKKHGMPLTEYNNFQSLSLEIMAQFCSTIVSPYLLTQTLSHLSIYQYCLDHNLSHVLIIEDSAKITGSLQTLKQILNKENDKSSKNMPSPKTPQEIQQILKAASMRQVKAMPWDIIYTDVDYHDPVTGEFIVPRLAAVPHNKTKINQEFSKINCRYGTVAYIISKSGMKKILEYYKKNWKDLPYDQILFNIPKLNILGLNHNIITNEYKRGKRKPKIIAQTTRIHQPHNIGQQYWVQPIELLCYERMDIIPKYIYAKYSLNKYKTNWHVDLYHNYLEKESQCYNMEPLKIGFNDFRRDFDNLIQSMQKKGFDENYAVRMNDLYIPWNGGHRIGTCLAMNIPVKVTAFERKAFPNFTADVFENSYYLEEKYLDHMVYEYSKLNKKTFVASLFPIGYEHKEQVEKILKKYGSIVHKKDFWLTEGGTLEFIRLVYSGEWWTGSYLDNYKHCRGKVLLTFPDKLRKVYPVRVYLFQCEHVSIANKAKEEVREHCQKSNHVIHINDTHEQTQLMTATIFNKNSRDFINQRELKRCENFDNLFSALKKIITDNQLDPDDFCISGDAVLSAYGIKDCSSIDILCHKPLSKNIEKELAESNKRLFFFHTKDADDIIFNPENHFYYNGMKFVKKY